MMRAMTTDRDVGSGERADLLETLGKHRFFLRHTANGLSDEEAGLRTTASELCVGGLIKHVALVESSWAGFILRGPAAMAGPDPADREAMKGIGEAHAQGFRMLPGETLAGLLDRYQEVAGRTDELVASLASLDESQALPPAPWFQPGARWSARRVLLHIIAETAQHAGHADIIRESLDGAKTMG